MTRTLRDSTATGIHVVPYDESRRREWDNFVESSKNGMFLFKRGYMEYHADRFPDASLMFYGEDGALRAVLPATRVGEVMSSHNGLTFGGFVTSSEMKVHGMLEGFALLRAYLKSNSVGKLIYKAIPHIYHRAPSQEDLYALMREGARLVRRDVTTTIDPFAPLAFSERRTRSTKKARQLGVEIHRSEDFGTFMEIMAEVLREKYNTRPVHSPGEIALLADRFPDNIKLFVARLAGSVVAGVIIYESTRVAHAQYIGATERGRECGAPDLLMTQLVGDYIASKKYFDFGISTEDAGRRLNDGLIENKESFGGRAIVHDWYELDIA